VKRAYLVTIPEFVVIADNEREAREIVDWAADSGSSTLKWLTAKELRARGNDFPAGDYDPDRELTCAEIADEMERAAVPPEPGR
jgi:hypothetical protein